MRITLVIFYILFYVAFACTTQKQPKTSAVIVKKDSVSVDTNEVHDTIVEALQKNNIMLLSGNWNVNTMKQSGLADENLNNVILVFNNDSTFSGKASCNNISGMYNLQGNNIKFGKIISTKMYCDKMRQEITYLKLLQETVIAYTVTKDSLLLQDSLDNIIFLATRKTI